MRVFLGFSGSVEATLLLKPCTTEFLACDRVSIRGRGPAVDASDNNQELLWVHVEKDPIVSYAAAPGSGLTFEAHQITVQRILLHGGEGGLNACLISCG